MVTITKAYVVDRGWTFEALWLALEFTEKLEQTGFHGPHLYDELEHRIEGAYLGYKRIYPSKDQIELWSKDALVAYRKHKKAKLIIENGSPRSPFAVLIFDLYKKGHLTEAKMRALYDKRYKLAVITKEEDQRLTDAGLCTKMLSTPEERWSKVGIKIVSVIVPALKNAAE